MSKTELKRELETRHMNMIAIGGAIGTGLFLGSGPAIAQAGPGNTLLAFCVVGLMVYFLMASLGEMATYMPVAGSFETYAAKFVDPAFGFALGWNYWFNWAITLATALVASAMTMQFWFPTSPAWIWSTVFAIGLFALNMLSARSFAETGFWFAGIKVVTCVIFLLVGAAFILGIGGQSPGFINWTVGEAPFVAGIGGFLGALIIAGFSFQGTELVGITAGESENPEVAIPKAIKDVFWRILLLYLGTLIIIGFLLPYTDENLLKASNDATAEQIAISPFTLIFKRAGLAAAAHVINAVILSAVLSGANAGVYASSRMLYALAKEGKAPKLFGNINKRGVPVEATVFTVIIGFMSVLTKLAGAEAVFAWLLNLSGVTGLIAWFGIAVSHYRFRKAYVAQNRDLGQLKYKAGMYPFGVLFALLLCLFIIFGHNYAAFKGDDVLAMFAPYVSLPVFLLMWFGYKYTKGTKVVPLEEVDFSN